MGNLMQTIDAFWTIFKNSANLGDVTHFVLPLNVKYVIGMDGIKILENRYRDMIEAPVVVSESISDNTIRIAPAQNPLGHDTIIMGAQQAKSKPRTSNKAKVTRPPNAFILYRQRHHPIVAAEYPNLHNNQISRLLGNQWNNESAANKARFIELSLGLKAQHLKDNPGYQYQPRKPSEKKRRQSRKISNTQAVVAASDAAQVPLAAPAALSVPLGDDALQFPKTASGNSVLELGGFDIDDEQLAAMLEEHNKSVPPPATAAAVLEDPKSAVLHCELAADAQDESNYFTAMMDDLSYLESLDFDKLFGDQAGSLSSPVFNNS